MIKNILWYCPKKASSHWLNKRRTHYKNLHAGPQAVLSILRNNFLPIAGKGEMRRVLAKCIICFRTKPTNIIQLMGDLPAIRVTQARVFFNTNIDYAGPFNIKISRNKIGKALTIFVCLVTKAVNFEIISDLTATAFLNALKWFISQRKKCVTLYSDITFLRTNNQLTELKKCLLKKITQQQRLLSWTIHRLEVHSILFTACRRKPPWNQLRRISEKSSVQAYYNLRNYNKL